MVNLKKTADKRKIYILIKLINMNRLQNAVQ